MNDRTPRSNDTRVEAERPKAWISPSAIPNPNPRQGVRYKWVRSAANGVTDKAQMHRAMVQGYVVTPPSDVPELAHLASGGYIEFGGLTLMHTAEEIVQQRNRAYLQQDAMQDEAVNQQLTSGQDARMPITNKSASESGFARVSRKSRQT